MRIPSNGREVRRGIVAVKMAVLMPVLVGIVAISVDGGVLLDKRRHVQAAADASALAAAGDLFNTYINSDYLDNGQDVGGTAKAHALAVAAANGYTNDSDSVAAGTSNGNSKITVNIPPTSGSYAGEPGHVEVIIEFRQQRSFSNIFTGGDIPVRARAVARGKWEAPKLGILLLEPSDPDALLVEGEALGHVTGASVLVNSTHATAAAHGKGSTAKIYADSFQVTGGVYQEAGNQFVGPINTGVAPSTDPFAKLPPPDPATLPLRSKETSTVINLGDGYKVYMLEPGRYVGGLLFDGKSSVIMAPGVYYMEGNTNSGGFVFKGSSLTSLNADGVMLYNARGTNTNTTPGSGGYPQISISGQASVRWTPPTSGTYKGMTFFQERGMDVDLYVAGNGGMDITGAFYAPDAKLDIAGNGDNIIGSQYVSGRLNLRGKGTYRVTWNPDVLPPVRQLKLVE